MVGVILHGLLLRNVNQVVVNNANDAGLHNHVKPLFQCVKSHGLCFETHLKYLVLY